MLLAATIAAHSHKGLAASGVELNRNKGDNSNNMKQSPLTSCEPTVSLLRCYSMMGVAIVMIIIRMMMEFGEV